MKNFDIIKDIDGLRTIYRYCATAEDFQVANPMVSATQARLALETMVKTVYRLKGWQIGERASLLSLTTDERLTAFIDSEDLMKRIHYVRKIGNNAAHASDGFVGRRESFFAVLNLYYIIGSILLAWQVIDTLPDFDKELIPQSPRASIFCYHADCRYCRKSGERKFRCTTYNGGCTACCKRPLGSGNPEIVYRPVASRSRLESF